MLLHETAINSFIIDAVVVIRYPDSTGARVAHLE
jgi:hypothetical protein